MTDRVFVGGLNIFSFSKTFREELISCYDSKKYTTANEDSTPHHSVVPNLGKFLALNRLHCFFKIKLSIIIKKQNKTKNLDDLSKW